MLPKYVGEVNHYNQSPIKAQRWDDENDNSFETAYQSQFNKNPQELMTRSRMEQENYYRQMMTQNENPYDRPEYN